MVEAAKETEGTTDAGIDRRRFIRRTAMVGGAAWAAPALLTLDRASAADLTSGPPTSSTPTTQPEVLPTEITQPPATVPGGGGGGGGGGPQVLGTTTGRGGSLPRTGIDTDVMVASGIAAVAGGAALTLWSAESEAAADPRS